MAKPSPGRPFQEGQGLYQRIIAEIRAVDPHHMLMVEGCRRKSRSAQLNSAQLQLKRRISWRCVTNRVHGIHWAPAHATVNPPSIKLNTSGNVALAANDGSGGRGNVVTSSDAFFNNSSSVHDINSLDNALLLAFILDWTTQ